MADELVRSDQADIDRKEGYLARVQHVQLGMVPRNIEEGLRLSDLLSKSSLVPPDFRGNPSNCFVAISMGAEVGLSPLQAIQGIAVINGRPSLYGDALLAVVQASGPFEWIDEPPVKDGVATCTVKRKGWPNPVSRSFTIEDAKRAHLWGKQGPWTNHPDRMLQMRARAFALRDTFADVLRGIASAEEMLDVSSATVTEQKPDPLQAMRNDLACTDEQWETVNALWDSIRIATPHRIVQAKRYSGKAEELIGALMDMGASLPVPAAIAAPEPKVVTKHQRKRLAKAKEEGTAPAPELREAIADVVTAIRETPEEQAESFVAALDPGATCEHGIDITQPCEACKALAAELDAEAAAQERVGPGTAAPKPETPQEYAARRKRELAELNKALPNVAPKSKEPF